MTVTDAMDEHLRVIRDLRDLVPEIERAAGEIEARLRNGGTIFFMGNGGSAADSQHLAAELVGRFKIERSALPGIALTTDTSILTSVGNDYGFDRIFARQIEALCSEKDVVVALSTSGNSPNVVLALEVAGGLGAYRIGLTGRDGGKMAAHCEQCLTVDSTSTARIQEAHILVGHILCDLVESSSSRPRQA
jgi:D-sedoheptulose 7-phosphate isomerase